MPISRRTLLRLLGVAAAVPGAFGSSGSSKWERRYRASATITLFSVPVVSRNDVGSGFAVIEESDRAIAIQFGAGSYPESAHGLNRLGFIQELLVERTSGEPVECNYFGFMTSSAEKDPEQARKALEHAGPTIPYAVAEGRGRNGVFASKLDRVALSSQVTWRDYPLLAAQVKAAVAASKSSELVEKRLDGMQAAPSTFLYAVRKALMCQDLRTSGWLSYNSKEFLLQTVKEQDPSTGTRFAARSLVREAGTVWRMNATLKEKVTGRTTPFKVYFEAGQEHMPPLRFEYQAKSFLKLSFEYDPAGSGPPVSTSLGKKENA